MRRGTAALLVLLILQPACRLALPRPSELEDAGAAGDQAVGGESRIDRSADQVPRRSCDELYGGATEYLLCRETATECEFSVRTEGTCGALCAKFGGTCLAARDNVSSNLCQSMGEDNCQTSNINEICVCSRWR